jgi:hypothetical protein
VLAIGASGAVASGAVSLGSKGVLVTNLCRLPGLNRQYRSNRSTSLLNRTPTVQMLLVARAQPIAILKMMATRYRTGDGGAGNSGSDGGDSGSGPVSTRVEVVVDPSADNGINSGGPASWSGSIFDTGYVESTADGYLRWDS